jgi:hypothetical protein
MLLKSILNRIQLHHGFVYGAVRLIDKANRLLLEIEIRPRTGSRPICSVCGLLRPGYDTLPVRRFEFVPLWGIGVFFLYAVRRVECPRCGIKVERVPWAEGKNHLTTTYAWFLAKWAKRLSWKEVAEVFETKWDNVFRSVKMAVAWGLSRVHHLGVRSCCHVQRTAQGYDRKSAAPQQERVEFVRPNGQTRKYPHIHRTLRGNMAHETEVHRGRGGCI